MTTHLLWSEKAWPHGMHGCIHASHTRVCSKRINVMSCCMLQHGEQYLQAEAVFQTISAFCCVSIAHPIDPYSSTCGTNLIAKDPSGYDVSAWWHFTTALLVGKIQNVCYGQIFELGQPAVGSGSSASLIWVRDYPFHCKLLAGSL